MGAPFVTILLIGTYVINDGLRFLEQVITVRFLSGIYIAERLFSRLAIHGNETIISPDVRQLRLL